jgi:hypothetical protein
VIVAVLAVRAVDMTVHDVIDVPGVRNRDVLAADAVLMLRIVRVAGVAGFARLEVAVAELVLDEVIAARVM